MRIRVSLQTAKSTIFSKSDYLGQAQQLAWSHQNWDTIQELTWLEQLLAAQLYRKERLFMPRLTNTFRTTQEWCEQTLMGCSFPSLASEQGRTSTNGRAGT